MFIDQFISEGFKIDPNNKESKDYQFVKWMARNKVKKNLLINILKWNFSNDNLRFIDVFIEYSRNWRPSRTARFIQLVTKFCLKIWSDSAS